MDKKINIVVIGQLTLDDVIKFDQPALLDSPGGSGLYALAGVCLWDVGPLGFITRQGNDYDLAPVFDKIGSRLDLKGVHQLDKPSIHIWSLFDRKGNRYFINQRWGSYDDVMGIFAEDIPDEYRSSQAYLVAAFPIQCQSEIIHELPSDAIILVDPHFQGVYPNFRSTWNELLKKISIFLPSEEELMRFFSIDAKDKVNDYIPYLEEISSLGPTVVGVKLGCRGAVIYDRNKDSAWHVPSYPVEKVIDVTGCGDAFCGGFLASYVLNKDVYISALHGVISASFNLEQYGVVHNYSIDHQRVMERFNEFSASLDRDRQKIK
jgi:sugar/nucleoside kinase (ribokinase family)